MLVTCQICKNKIERDTAYKRVVGKANKYYCSEQEWQTEEDKKKKAAEDKDKVYKLICDILGEAEVLNTALWKEKAIWNKAFSDEIIAKYLQEHKDYLTSAVSKLSGTEYAKIRYVSAVLKNSLRDFKPKVEVVEKPRVIENDSFELFEPSVTPTQTDNVILEDVEDDLI